MITVTTVLATDSAQEWTEIKAALADEIGPSGAVVDDVARMLTSAVQATWLNAAKGQTMASNIVVVAP